MKVTTTRYVTLHYSGNLTDCTKDTPGAVAVGNYPNDDRPVCVEHQCFLQACWKDHEVDMTDRRK